MTGLEQRLASLSPEKRLLLEKRLRREGLKARPGGHAMGRSLRPARGRLVLTQ